MATQAITPTLLAFTLSTNNAPNEKSGEALAQGLWVYKDADTLKVHPLIANGTAAQATPHGITGNEVTAADQDIQVVGTDTLCAIVAAGLVIGTMYCASETPGVMGELADVVGAGKFPTLLAQAKSATEIGFDVRSSNNASKVPEATV